MPTHITSSSTSGVRRVKTSNASRGISSRSNSESNRPQLINKVSMVTSIPESMNVTNEEDDDSNENDEEEEDNNSFAHFDPFSDSSQGGSSDDKEQLIMNEDGNCTIEDLVQGIDTSFDNTDLEELLEQYNHEYEEEVNENQDSDGYSSDETSTHNDEENEPIPIGGNAAMRAQVSLLRLLEESSVPIGLFDKIMDWASEAKSFGYDFPTTPKRRATIIKHFSTRFQMHDMHAKETTFPMEGGGLGTITHFDFEAMVHSLLADPRIAKSLIINWENPNEGVGNKASPDVGDIHTGKWFHNTQKRMCTDRNDLLCPIILACDRAHCDEGGKSRLSLEPMLFTLAIIPQELRVYEWAWRPLGYLNNLHLAPSAEIAARSPGQNVRNTHRMLRIMFAGLESLQQDGGLYVNVLNQESQGSVMQLLFKFAIAFVIGDCKGHDVLCGRYASHQILMLCRDCNCSLNNADDHTIICQMRNISDIKKLTDQAPTTEVLSQLQVLGQHYVRNAFYHLDFGENPGGIHTATPIEILHGLELGWFKYALRGFFQLLTPAHVKQFDLLSKGFSEQHKHQSYRDFPRTSFPHGFSNVTRLQGHEYVGCLLLSVLILSSRPWKVLMETISPKSQRRIKQYHELFEILLSFHAFTKRKEHPKRLFRIKRGESQSPATAAIAVCIQKFKTVVRRKKGHGSKLTKVHQMPHLGHYIEQFGAAINWFGAPCESLHKHFVKKPGKKTQRRPDSFEHQSARRLVESYVIGLAHGQIMGHFKDKQTSPFSRPIGGSKFNIHVELNRHGNYTVGCHRIVWKEKKSTKNKMRTSLHVGAIISTIKSCYTLFPRSPNGTIVIPCFTEHKSEGVIYHGHPNFRGLGQWHDYAYFNWEGVPDPLIARIQFFVDLSHANDECVMSDKERYVIEHFYTEPTYYAVTQSSNRRATDKANSVLLSSTKLDHLEWYLPPVSAIEGPVYCVFDSLAEETEDRLTVATPQHLWHTQFV